MSNTTKLELQDAAANRAYGPTVTMILPFDPKMASKQEINSVIRRSLTEVENQLNLSYRPDVRTFVLEKLRSVVGSLNSGTHTKSVAIFVSPVIEKVIYLDVPVREMVAVDYSFDIREIVYNKKSILDFLVLTISAKESKIYRGNACSLVKILTDAPGSVFSVINEAPEPVANFSDKQSRRQIILNKFLRHIDDSLGILLNAYHLPVFVLGPEKVTGHFKQVSKHKNAVIEYMTGNFDDVSIAELREVLRPHLAKWQDNRREELLKIIDDAASSGKLSTGIRNVWKSATNARGRLLLVEKGFMQGEMPGAKPVIYMPGKPYSKFSPVKDVVADVIEKVFTSGGDVEFVEDDLLGSHDHIALVQYY